MKKNICFVIAIIFSVNFSFAKDKRTFNNEHLRPQFHFTPETNWMNDPNGLIYYDGEYHLFYQHNPKGLEWGYMHWGHAVSKDLVHWEYLPIALYPDNNSEDIKECTAFSGSGIVDHQNVTGLQKGDEKTILLFYTSFGCGQRIAYSNDKGRTWNKYENNPIIPFDEKDDARDPKVFWHKQSQKYVMVLWRKPDGNDAAQGISIYNSENLIDWKFQSHIPGFYECPDLVELPVNRRQDDKKWVLFDGDGSYLIGMFDGEKFTPQSTKMKGDYGTNYYATQTWNNIPEEDGRIIQIAWMRGGKYPEMPFNGQMTFPVEISLVKFKEGIRLVKKPVKEIENLHVKEYLWEQKNIIPGLNKNLIHKVKGDCLHIKTTVDTKTANTFGFLLRGNKNNEGTDININCLKNTITCLGKQAQIHPVNKNIQLEILLDRSSIEVFVNGGRTVLSSCFEPAEDALNVILYSAGGELFIEKMDIYTLKSIWESDEK